MYLLNLKRKENGKGFISLVKKKKNKTKKEMDTRKNTLDAKQSQTQKINSSSLIITKHRHPENTEIKNTASKESILLEFEIHSVGKTTVCSISINHKTTVTPARTAETLSPLSRQRRQQQGSSLRFHSNCNNPIR